MCKPVFPDVLTYDSMWSSSSKSFKSSATSTVALKPFTLYSGSSPSFSFPEYMYGSRSKTTKSGVSRPHFSSSNGRGEEEEEQLAVLLHALKSCTLLYHECISMHPRLAIQSSVSLLLHIK